MKKIAFTIVLNGMPYIRQQVEIIPKIFDVWYIVEGATLPIKDTSWCRNIDNKFYTSDKLSVDGTTEFLNEIASDKIKIIRKNDFWNGKVEMCNSFMNDVEDTILMEFDVDEIWKKETLSEVINYAESNEGFDGMLFRCNYYVGPNLLTQGDNCYGNNAYEWSRLWKIKSKTKWISHEPPKINGCDVFIQKNWTADKGWIFDHYAYALETQLEFKENFYGYTGAVEQWKKLQSQTNFPIQLNQFFPWVDSLVNVIKL
jgi:hypothetical protein